MLSKGFSRDQTEKLCGFMQNWFNLMLIFRKLICISLMTLSRLELASETVDFIIQTHTIIFAKRTIMLSYLVTVLLAFVQNRILQSLKSLGFKLFCNLFIKIFCEKLYIKF